MYHKGAGFVKFRRTYEMLRCGQAGSASFIDGMSRNMYM